MSSTACIKAVPLHAKKLTTRLAEIFAGRSGGKSKRWMEGSGGSARSEIVSAKLCDDLISYLAPTLEQHKGCTLIDVHPGACLWSQKLHEFLKPKRHILMEPEERYRDEFIEPLLTQPGSSYRYTTRVGAHPASYWDNYKAMFEEPDLFPPMEYLKPEDPRRFQLNPNLLVTGNLARKYHARARANELSYAPLTLQHMTSAALTNDIFHQFGLVRMLWWVPESLHILKLSDNTVDRNTWEVAATLGAGLTKVAGSQPPKEPESAATKYLQSFRHRDKSVKAWVSDNVTQRMEQNGVRIPEGRKPLVPPTSLAGQDVAFKSPFSTHLANLVALKREIKQVEDRIRAAYTELSSSKTVKDKRKWQDAHTSNAFPQLEQVIATQDAISKIGGYRTTVLADISLRIVRLEVNCDAFARAHPRHPDIEKLRSAIIDMDREYEGYMEELVPEKVSEQVQWLCDNQLGTFLEPPLFCLDNRTMDTLKIESGEIWPECTLMLLDLVPNGRDLANPGLSDARQGLVVARMLLKQLWEKRSRPLVESLNYIAPNAAQDLIPMVPAITDPSKGGRWDPSKIIVRQLTSEMLEGLAKAWFEWPFKPSNSELVSLSSEEGSSLPSDEDHDDH